jgi:hypothetical protein
MARTTCNLPYASRVVFSEVGNNSYEVADFPATNALQHETDGLILYNLLPRYHLGINSNKNITCTALQWTAMLCSVTCIELQYYLHCNAILLALYCTTLQYYLHCTALHCNITCTVLQCYAVLLASNCNITCTALHCTDSCALTIQPVANSECGVLRHSNLCRPTE